MIRPLEVLQRLTKFLGISPYASNFKYEVTAFPTPEPPRTLPSPAPLATYPRPLSSPLSLVAGRMSLPLTTVALGY